MKITLTLCAASVASLASIATAQSLVRSINGPAANAQFGKVCIVVPDMNADGFKDLLVGTPGFNQDRGAVYCVSGAYLALGVGSPTLWSCMPTANPGDRFGSALGDLGDLTGDGVHEFLVGEPGYDMTGAADIGAVRVLNGASHAVTSLVTGFEAGSSFGAAFAICGTTAILGAPGPSCPTSRFCSVAVSLLKTDHTISSIANSTGGSLGSAEMGAVIVGGFDLDGDGRLDFVIGAPGENSNAGSVRTGTIVSVGSYGLTGSYFGSNAGERLGSSIDAIDDWDGDGMRDLVVGAPNAPDSQAAEGGRVAIVSGASLIQHVGQYEITSWTLPNAPPGLACHFGAAVRACGDLNGDGVGDILVGAPEFVVYQGLTPFVRGNLSIYSGASGGRLAGINGGNFENFGGAIAGAIGDLDGDGFPEFVAAAPLANVGIGGGGTGVVRCYRLFPVTPATYCTGKLNSLGCTPTISFSGSPSANPTAPFLISASNFVNQKNGLLFYAHAPMSVPFQGGIKCVLNPTVRTPPKSSGGAASGSSCTGTYSFDFNDWLVNGWDATLAAGDEVYAQYWSRDPASASHTSLSNALRFVINP